MLILLDVLFVMICLLLVFMVVITPSQEQGIASAFGGVGSDTFFGTKAHQHISKFTVFLAVSFLVLGTAINLKVQGLKKSSGSIMEGTGSGEKTPAGTTNPPLLPPPPK